MKKSLVIVALLVLVQVSFTFGQVPETPKQLADIFNAVVNVEDAAAVGDWGVAQQKVAEIKSMMLEVAPAVQQVFGEHAYKAIDGFIVQLQQALLAKDRSAAEGSLISLQKMNDWLTSQYPTGS